MTSYSVTCRIALLSAEIAQLVEHATENRGVASSILALGTKTPFAGFLFFLIKSPAMELLKKFGKPAAIVFMGLGVLLMLYAWTISPKAFSAEVWTDSSSAPVEIQVTDLIAANWLLEAGIPLYPGDSILYSGVEIDPDFKLPAKQGQALTYRTAYPITLESGGEQRVFYSSAPTLGAALWEQDIQLTASDVTSLPLDTPVIAPLTVRIGKAVPLTIQVDGQTLAVSSAGATVGEALAEAGLALENLDKSIPADDQPIPADGVIRVVRVREETILEENAIAYAEVRVADEAMEIGTEEITQAGPEWRAGHQRARAL